MTAVWVALVVGGFATSVLASRRAVADATELARGSRLPPFVIGVTLLAIGTDLPEIANSVVASSAGHGDVNVGDSLGSTATQLTLVLGLVSFSGFALGLGGDGQGSLAGHRATAWLTVAAVGAIAVLSSDDHLGRLDATVLIVGWLAGATFIHRRAKTGPQLHLDERAEGRGRLLAGLVASLVAIGVGATVAVTAMVELAERWGVPEFIIAYFGASLGTSMPELVVVLTALAGRQSELAIGDILGSSFADATLSISAGPLLFPVAVDGGLALRGCVVAAAAAGVVGLLLGRAGGDRRTGAILLVVYAASWPVIL